MRSEIINLDMPEVEAGARAEFYKRCGFNSGSGKHRRMMRMAEAVLEKGRPGLRPLAIVSAYGNSVIHDGEIILEGIGFKCGAFSHMAPENVRGVYAYILTVGGINAEGGVMDQMFADMWGTAFADGALKALENSLGEHAGAGAVSSFGPGFYGMEIGDISRLFRLLDGAAIGVEIRAGSYMLPIKSCAGFIVAADSALALPAADCAHCVGNRGSCRYCKNNPKAMEYPEPWGNSYSNCYGGNYTPVK